MHLKDSPVPLSNFAYCSQLSPSADVSCVANIIKTARVFNKAHEITGILIFDGQRFFQYIEGPYDPLQMLVGGLYEDRRHTDIKEKQDVFFQKTRIFSKWSMAYVLVDDSEPIDDLEKINGAEMMNKLHALLPMLDVV